MTKTGRPTKLTDELQDALVEKLREGNYIETACALVGITDRTYYRWIERAEDELERVAKNPRRRIQKSEEPFIQFRQAVKKARAEAESEAVTAIRQEGKKTWTAYAWWLERSFPDRWGRKDRHEHTGPDGEAIVVKVLKGVTVDDL